MKRDLLWRFASVGFALLVVALWELEADRELVSQLYVPSARRTFTALWTGIESGVLTVRFLATLQRMLYGWLLASLLGVAIGAAIGSSRSLREFLQPTLEYLRPMPASAIIPVVIPILGLTETMVLSVTAFAALWPTLLATVHGFASVEPRLQEVAKVLRIGRFGYLTKFALPNAFPDILAGIRLSLTYSLILSVVGEMLAGREGLGSWILTSARFFKAPDLFAGALLLGLIGYLSARVIARVEHRLLRWRITT